MANVDLIAATVRQLLSQTTALLQQDETVVIEDETLANLERDTQLAMVQLRRCRNDSIVPVNRLPAELLLMVLGHLRCPPTIRSSRQISAPMFDSYRPLVSAMLVCHKWYSIGYQAASLWTDIDFRVGRRRAFATVLLARSLGAAVRLYGPLNEDNALGTVIADHGTRIRELDVWAGANVSNPVLALRSVLAVDMPRVRILALSCGDSDARDQEGAAVITDSDAPASFPALEAMLLESFLFVPTHVLPQLTHLHLARLDQVNPSSILNLLRNTPALEVFDIMQCQEFTAPFNSTPLPRPSPVFLPRLHSVYIGYLATTTVHDLMTRIEAPNLACLRLSSISAASGALLSMPLIPSTLTTRTVNRLAFDLRGDFTMFHITFHGEDLSLTMDIRGSIRVRDTEGSRWAFGVFPTLLPLAHVEEFHFQAQLWATGRAERLLPHLAARMPRVSTLFVKHNWTRDSGGTECLMDCARAVAALLERDAPVLFPRLARLELIVSDVPPAEFCALIAPALARRDLGGRRLRTVRIRPDDLDWFRWSMELVARWEEAGPDYAETGIRDHVDSVEVGTGKAKDARGRSSRGGVGGDHERTNTFAWGRWKDRVQPRPHGYWLGSE